MGAVPSVGAIFDLDGTLVNSYPQIERALNTARRELGMETLGFDEVKSRVGLPASNLFLDCPPETLNEAVSRFRWHLESEINNGNQLFPGVVNLLSQLRSFGWKIGIATSKPHKLARLVVEKSMLNGLIDWTQGILDFPVKPHPRVIFECQQKLKATRYLMIGDRPEDIAAGLASECLTVGIGQGSFSVREMIESGAHFAFRDMLALHAGIRNIIYYLETEK